MRDIHEQQVSSDAASESAIIATLPPGNYTAIVRGKNIVIEGLLWWKCTTWIKSIVAKQEGDRRTAAKAN